MNEKEIRKVLLEALQKASETPIDVSTLKDEMHLKNDLGLDSMSLVEMTWAIEEKLGINIPDTRMKDIATIADVIAITDELVKARAA